MEYTKNLNLKKPEQDDYYDIENENDNMDILDSEVAGRIKGFDVETEDDIPTPTRNLRGVICHILSNETHKVCIQTKPITYDFEVKEYTSGTDAEKPEEGYYHATDTNKWYLDASEIEVEIIPELPEASIETRGKYYLCNNELNLGVEILDTYEWRAFGLPELIYKNADGEIIKVESHKGTIIMPSSDTLPTIADGYTLETYEAT